MKLQLVLFLILIPLVDLHAQWKTIKKFDTEDAIVNVAVDRPGDFYVVTRGNTIHKLDVNGQTLSKAKFDFLIQNFDPHDGARLSAYAPGSTSLLSINPVLEIRNTMYIDSSLVIDPFMACSAGDYDLVVIDSADWSMKRINTKTQTILSENIIPDSIRTGAKLISMRGYQHFIFLLDTNYGIRIFNGMGKYLRGIPAKGIKGFNFLGEELYYPLGKDLYFFDLFNAETRTQSLPATADYVILTDERLLSVAGNTVQIFAPAP